MTCVWKYVALHVPDLRAAEAFYGDVLALEVLFREHVGEDGAWHTLRPEVDWDDAAELGIEVGMVALRRGGLVLALFPGSPPTGALYELCVGVGRDDLEAIRARAGAPLVESHSDWFRFDDPFGFRWVVQTAEAAFRSSGESAGRWAP